MMNKGKYDVVLIFGLFILLGVIIFIVPNNQLYKNNGKLIISEVMSSNDKTIKDSYGKSSDYIEIYNGYDEDINLKGYYLSDDSFMIKKWQFPEIVIKANDYLVIFASGKNSLSENELHTNFKLDMKGESIILSDRDGNVLSKIYANLGLKDTSYGYDFDSKNYYYYFEGTPGRENGNNYSKKIITVKKDNTTEEEKSEKKSKQIRINEVSIITD